MKLSKGSALQLHRETDRQQKSVFIDNRDGRPDGKGSCCDFQTGAAQERTRSEKTNTWMPSFSFDRSRMNLDRIKPVWGVECLLISAADIDTRMHACLL